MYHSKIIPLVFCLGCFCLLSAQLASQTTHGTFTIDQRYNGAITGVRGNFRDESASDVD